MQTLVLSSLDGCFSLFAYGCGRGDDVRGLIGNGLSATGWDPCHAPDRSIRTADIGNRGFVVNFPLVHRVCERLGAALDFIIDDENMLEAARWIVAHTPFDRLYFHGADQPIHVSFGPNQDRQVVRMTAVQSGRRVPPVIPREQFLALASYRFPMHFVARQRGGLGRGDSESPASAAECG